MESEVTGVGIVSAKDRGANILEGVHDRPPRMLLAAFGGNKRRLRSKMFDKFSIDVSAAAVVGNLHPSTAAQRISLRGLPECTDSCVTGEDK